MKTHTKQNAEAGIQKSEANTQHTPGPWAFNSTHCGEPVIKDASGRMVMRLAGTDQDRGEDKSNARLVAAAPELLAALELANMLLIEYLPKEKPATNHNLRHIQDAIAKATGK